MRINNWRIISCELTTDKLFHVILQPAYYFVLLYNWCIIFYYFTTDSLFNVNLQLAHYLMLVYKLGITSCYFTADSLFHVTLQLFAVWLSHCAFMICFNQRVSAFEKSESPLWIFSNDIWIFSSGVWPSICWENNLNLLNHGYSLLLPPEKDTQLYNRCLISC